MSFKAIEKLVNLLPSRRKKRHQEQVTAQVNALIQTMQSNPATRMACCCQIGPQATQPRCH